MDMATLTPIQNKIVNGFPYRAEELHLPHGLNVYKYEDWSMFLK